MSVACKLLQDSEPMVRAEILEHIPPIALFCRKHPLDLEIVIRQQLLPISLKLITDSQIQVRKAGQASLLLLLEQNLIEQHLLREWICPLIVQIAMSLNSAEDMRIEGLNIMSKMFPLVGKNLTVEFFLEPFTSLCCETSFGIRKVCASSFGSLCKVVGRNISELTLLPPFVNLCSDEHKDVRKACAEVFVDVATVLGIKTRKEVLPHLYINLLNDTSKWVYIVAFRELGGVISTYADPSKTGLYYDYHNGHVLYFPELIESSHLQNGIISQEESSSTQEIELNTLSFNKVKNSITTKKENQNPLLNSDDDFLNLNNRISHIDISGFRDVQNRLTDDGNSNNQNHSLMTENENLCNHTLNESESKLSAQENCQKNSEPEPENILNTDSLKNQTSPSSDNNFIEKNDDIDNSPNLDHSKPDNSQDSPLAIATKDGHIHLHIDNENVYNNFQFWRLPLPEIELDIDIEDGKATNIHVRAKMHDEKTSKSCASDLRVKISSENETESAITTDSENTNYSAQSKIMRMQVQTACINTVGSLNSDDDLLDDDITSSSFTESRLTFRDGEISEIRSVSSKLGDTGTKLSNLIPELPEEPMSPYSQDIIPPGLLAKYLSMADSKTNDLEIIEYCAFNFPAVAYTLGRKYWPCLRNLLSNLTASMQWKARKTIAASLHDLAVIVGNDLTVRDLFPLFVILLQDLDEVRLGAISHLSSFLKFLQPFDRKMFLPLLDELLKTDNERNWRFRYVLAEQLCPTVEFYSANEVYDYIYPVAMCLIVDKVCQVRQASIELNAAILRRLSRSNKQDLIKSLLNSFDEKFRKSSKWLYRQVYVLLCQQFAHLNSLPMEIYVEEIVPNLLSLAWDKVPNVRIAVARCLSLTLVPFNYLPSIVKVHYQLFLQVVNSLLIDADRDVRYYVYLSSDVFKMIITKKV